MSAAPEPVEDAGQFVGGDAGAGVGDGQHRVRPGGPGRDGDVAARRGELQRVGQQVGDDLVQPARVGVDAGRREPSLQGDPGRLELPGQAVGGGGGQAGQVAGAPGQVQGGGVGGGQVLQVADHAGQPQHLIAQRRQLVRGGLGDPVEQGLVPGLQDRDRGAQLVRDVGDQVAAQLVLPVQGVGHLVERGGQLAQLGRAGDRADPGGAFAASHGPGYRDDPLHRPGDPPGHGQTGEHGQHRGQPGRTPDGPQQVRLQRMVGAGQPGTGEPDDGLTDPVAAHQHRRALLRRSRLRGETRRGDDDLAGLIADLDLRPGPGGQVQHRGQVGRVPALAAVPGAGRGGRDRAGQIRPLLAGQGRDIRGGERRGEPGEQGHRGQRDREEGQRQPQAERAAAGRRGRRRAGRRSGRGRRAAGVSHRGSGPAGTRRPGPSARSAAGPGPARSCGAGSSRASRWCAHTPRTHTRGPG